MLLFGVTDPKRFGRLVAELELELELLLGVFALATGIGLEIFPCIAGRLRVDGEFDRVDVGLEDPEGLLSFRTETGNREVVDDGPRSMWGLEREA